jgi:hypothetical protein
MLLGPDKVSSSELCLDELALVEEASFVGLAKRLSDLSIAVWGNC